MARFEVEAFGEATNSVEFAYSRMRWDILVAFENTSTNSISLSWDLNYLFINTAVSDPHGTAFSTSRLRAQQGTIVNGERITEPEIFEAVTAACGQTTTCLPGSKNAASLTLDYILGAGEIGFFNFELIAEGSASVISEPTNLWLLGTAMIILLGFRRSKT